MIEKGLHEGCCFWTAGDRSSSPSLVLVHGVGLEQRMWIPWIETLEPACHVVTFDLYGHGGSANPPGERCIRDFTDQLNSLVDHLGIKRFALAGFSLGALISQAYASVYPERLSHLVLLHSVYRRTEAQCQAVRERYRLTREQGPMANVEQALERWYTEDYRARHPEDMNVIREIFSGHTGDGYLKAYYCFCHAETEMRRYPLVGVGCPALVITGSDDVGSTPDMSRQLAAVLPDSEVIINAGHRHMAPAEFSDTLCDQVLSFLHRHPCTDSAGKSL